MNLSNRIKQLRLSQGLTQQELADKLSISRSTLAGYESESKLPSYEVLIEIANYFNVSTDYLLSVGLFNDSSYHLIVLYRDVILQKLYTEKIITQELFCKLHTCNIDKCIMFLSTVISSVSGDINSITYSYHPTIGELGRKVYETLTSDQRENLKNGGLEEFYTDPKQTDLIDKLDNLSPEEQKKIYNYINMSYEMEKGTSTLTDANVNTSSDNKPGKSLPSSGTGGDTMAV